MSLEHKEICIWTMRLDGVIGTKPLGHGKCLAKGGMLSVCGVRITINHMSTLREHEVYLTMLHELALKIIKRELYHNPSRACISNKKFGVSPFLDGIDM